MSPARLRLLAYLALAIALIVLDHRGGWLAQIRARSAVAGAAVVVAGRRRRRGWATRSSDDASHARAALADENRVLRNALLISGARLSRLQAAAAENARLRGLLGAASAAASTCSSRRSSTSTSIPPASAWCSMPAAATACRSDRRVIDAGGLIGQIIAVHADDARPCC